MLAKLAMQYSTRHRKLRTHVHGRLRARASRYEVTGLGSIWRAMMNRAEQLNAFAK
jgi:hypothetical protein